VSDIGSYIQDALDSIEFAMGATSTKYGAIRASMGHPAPFTINYVAIGNEDCGKQYYNENYVLFYNALSKSYPNIKLVANCQFNNASIPVQYWDYHLYPAPDSFLTMQSQTQFDNSDRKSMQYVFNSEYASRGNGVGNGNLYAAIGESVWMTGLQRNSDLVKIASYAPLLENINSAEWHPNMIRYVQGNGGHSIFGTPSYWNQWMYAHANIGLDPSTHRTLTYVLPPIGRDMTVAAAPSIAMSQKGSDVLLILKLINYGAEAVNLHLSLEGVSASTTWKGQLWTMTANRTAENTLDNPTAVTPIASDITLSTNTTIAMNAFSIMFIQAVQSVQPADKNSGYATY